MWSPRRLKKGIQSQRKIYFIFGEGNGNPLQCSCLENRKDGGGRLSGTVSPFRAEQGTSLETPWRARAPRRAGRRDAGVRADFGRREFLEPQEGRPPAIYPILCPEGWVPSLTHPPPFAAGSGRLCARGLVFAVCRVRLLTLGSHSPLLWTSYPAFVEGVGTESRERPQMRPMEPGVKWRGCK